MGIDFPGDVERVLSDLAGAGSRARKDPRPYPSPSTLAKYRLSRDEWAKIWDWQDGACPLCQKRRTLVIDHDHKTGAVRGLLCNLCNGMLGKVKDDREWLLRAAKYLSCPPASWLDIQATARTLGTTRRRRRRTPRR